MKRTLYLVFFTFLFVLTYTSIQAQETETQTISSEISQGRLLGKTAPLSELIDQNGGWHSGSKKKFKNTHPKEIPNFEGSTPAQALFEDTALPKDGDPLRFTDVEKNTFEILPRLVIEGMDEDLSGVAPPDPVGDLSNDHYIQMMNASSGALFQIFDKEGNVITSPESANIFWQPFNVTGLGDPIILWDQAAQRWLLSELGQLGSNVMLVAISETSDPMGSWMAYEFQAPTLPDYPKFGIWHDAYYITTNEPGDAESMNMYVIERNAMLAGSTTVDLQRLSIPRFLPEMNFESTTPVNWEGNNPPPPGSPHYIIRMYDDAWAGGVDKMEVWEVHIDWDTPSNSFTSGPLELPTAPFNSELCDDGGIFNCIEQPGPQLLSPLQHVVMFPVPYRNFGTHESIVYNFSVDVGNNNQAGIRWGELRKFPGGEWELYQEGTYAPDDLSRFMGSININGSGNLLMGYSVVSSTKSQSLRFTGRLANDPLGEMTVDEYEFGEGAGSYGGFRWGDYSSMSVDPADNQTFWFTGEYMKGNQWGTKIMSTIIRRDSNDMGVQVLIEPQNSGFLTDSETVTVAVRNFGFYDQDSVGVSMIFNGEPVVTEIIADTIKADSTYLHTFTPTVDMSAIGDYPFTFYTTLESDTAFFNDTLRVLVSQLERFDAAITSFDNLAFPFCDTIIDIGIVLTNIGVDTLTSANVVYQFNGGTDNSIPWTGVLATGESDTIIVLADNFVEGTNSITASSNTPNGVMDQAPGNDTLSRTYLVINEGRTIRLELLTDDYPEETSWEIRDLEGNILYFEGPYDDVAPQTLIIREFCLQDGCFEFTIFDSFGDGIQFNGVEGNYQILNEDGIVLASLQNVNFGSSETVEFCSDFECSILANFLPRNESEEGAEDGRILLSANGGNPPYQYSIDGGENFQFNSLFSGLSGGDYEVIIIDEMGCETTLAITLYTCALSADVEIVNASDLGSNDGAVTVTVDGGIPPFVYSLDGETGDQQSDPVFTDLPAGTYQLFVEDSVGCEYEMEIMVGPSTSTDESDYVSGVELIPNPTNGYLTVNVHGLTGVPVLPVRILDATGKVVRHNRLVAYNDVLTNRISLHGLPNGLYYLHFLNDKVENLVKVIKQD